MNLKKGYQVKKLGEDIEYMHVICHGEVGVY